ncbi:MAG TPA: hypothetical protein VMT19_08205 [Thermoanaerobaculaceae bacterium]|nr:hypothetical protein [Thermoanaerobaculaceae bacterium]
MRAGWVAALCGLACLAAGCAVTRQGTLTGGTPAVTVPVSVAVGAESAAVHGTNPQTGERLEGTFHLTREERTPSPVGIPGPPPSFGGGAVSPGTGPGYAASGPAVIAMSGRLEGDKGTSLRCTLQVKKGLNLQGVGVCRPSEGAEEGIVYRLRF